MRKKRLASNRLVARSNDETNLKRGFRESARLIRIDKGKRNSEERRERPLQAQDRVILITLIKFEVITVRRAVT